MSEFRMNIIAQQQAETLIILAVVKENLAAAHASLKGRGR